MLTLALFVVTLASPIATTSATGASINDDVEKAQASVEITSPPARAESQATTRVRVRETYGKLPLYFEVNRGQSDSRVQFLARGPQQTLFLTSTEAVLVLMKRDPLAYEPAAHGKSEMRGPATGTVLRMAFTGANPTPRVTGLEELPGKANYFVGNDPTRWRASVPTYAKVRYDDLYPGVDLVYYGNQRQLEYDFVVRPGAEPTRIVLHFQGADRLEVDAQGDLVLYAAGHAIRQRKPVIYQEVDGVRKEIRGGYVLKNHHQVGFRLAAYDATRPLVIDPVLVYSTYLGGTGVDSAFGIAVDAAGSAYVTGETLSTDFPTTAGTLQPTPLGGINAFVTKLNPAGLGSADLVYSTYLGGSGTDRGRAIAVDSVGNAYVTGSTSSSNFPTTPGAFQLAPRGLDDAFVTKLNPAGTAPLYSTYLGGTADDSGTGIAVDSLTALIYVTGETQSLTFPTTAGAFRTTFGGGSPPFDAFVTKLNPAGLGSADLVYSTYLGGNGSDRARAIALDSVGHAYVTGVTNSTNFPTTTGAFQPTPVAPGVNTGFVTKLNPAGLGSADLIYSTYLGGSSGDSGSGIAVDSPGNAYVTGSTFSSNFPTTAGAFQPTLGNAPGFGSDAFVTKLNPAGLGSADLVYSTYLGGGGSDVGGGIAVDSSGNAYVTGSTSSSNFPTAGAFQPTLAGGFDAFVTKLNPAGLGSADLIYSTYLGGSFDDVGRGIAVDSLGNAYVTGSTQSTDFPTTAGAFQPTSGGSGDAFVAKITAIGPPETLTLAPKTATNPLDTQHCVTATVQDAVGDPVPGVTVRFAVTGAVNTSGSVATGQNGQATFCYMGPASPGEDAITAYADTNNNVMQDPGEPFDTATKTWVTPPDTIPPDTSIDSAVGHGNKPISNGGTTHSNLIRFTFSGSDNSGSVASFECSLDGAGFSSCTSPTTYKGLSKGTHTFEVRAIDSAGNTDPTPATWTWTRQ